MNRSMEAWRIRLIIDSLFAVQLLDEAGAVQFLDEARIHECFGVCSCGLWIRARQIIEHGLDAIRSGIGNFRKDVGIIFVGSFQSFRIGNAQILLEQDLWHIPFRF